jgi:hypothetical protein
LLHEPSDTTIPKPNPDNNDGNDNDRNRTDDDDDDKPHHALLTSHHLLSSTKRRLLAQWSAAHGLAGFAKLGHPGVIYACGASAPAVRTFVAQVKALRWLALRVRFVEPLPPDGLPPVPPGWREFEKVGEVVEFMRACGRERYVVEMGIGSAGVK